jgi:cardiolipin synthase A/B
MKYTAVAALVAALAAAGCRTDDAGNTSDGGATVDALDGVGCTALSPRSVPVESFIGPTGFEARMGALIDGAKTSLDIQMYLFTVTSIANKIVAAKARGVTVRLLLDPDHEGNQNVTPILTSGGINWKSAPTIYTFSHAKYLIVDGSTAVIMSANWNIDAMGSERNHGVVDKDPEDVADLQAIFDGDWALSNGLAPAPANLDCTRLVVSPNNSKVRLLEHIKSAQSTLDVQVMYLSETSIRNEIGAAKTRGVTVRVMINDPLDEAVPYLKDLGIPLKEPSSFSSHAKLLIADDVAFVGSENMSFTSLSKNREVGVLVFEPSAFAPIQSQFDSDWAASTTIP